MLGNIYSNKDFFHCDYYAAINYYDIALKNDPNNYLCLKNWEYFYEKQKDYLNVLMILDKLLNINEKDSLVLCYYGEILCNMIRYSKAILYFTKANIVDPENIHNLNRRAITYYIIQEYDKVLSDLDKIIQLDPLNNSAYYLKSLTYYTKNDINNAEISFKKLAALLNSDNRLSETQLIHLEYLLNNNSSKELNNILTKIDQIPMSDLLRFIRCKIHIELKEYYEAKIYFDTLLELADEKERLSHIHLLQKYSDFWSYLYEFYKISGHDFTELGIVNKFSEYIYKENKVYFISNLTNFNSELRQFQESDISSLLGLVLHSKNEKLRLDLPRLTIFYLNLICKINVKKILSEDFFIKFISRLPRSYVKICCVKTRYEIPIFPSYDSQLSIEINSIEMQIDYIRFGRNPHKITHIHNSLMGYLLPDYHQICPNVPKTFGDMYFSRKEMENLLDLKDILNK
ncbi:TPR-like protein [Rhizophagus irregularis]|uniref:TPR-like protein n=1 Tax=Rhizophagus irregularis TaxID=588596 RepID=A0A2N0RW30_9GLOM|nr:TPR-like protein [Rhizophagus irregularis]